MRYRQLTEIGHHYSAEVGTSGVRTNPAVWRGIETKLKTAIVDLRNRTSNPFLAPVAGNTISQRKEFFQRAADATKIDKTRDKGNAQEAEKARKDIAFFRKWLAKEGASADNDGNVIMAPMGNLTVYYDNDLAAQGLTKVHFSAGKMYRDSGCSVPFDTTKMVTHFSGPGKAIYVMSITGNIHIASHIVGNYHHSSLLGGSKVACAGEIEVVAGVVRWLSNKSGHYFPNPDHLIQVLHQLQKKGIPLTFPLTVISATGAKTEFPNVGQFLQDRQLNDLPDYEFQKLMAYSEHLNDAVLVRNNWRWRGSVAEPVGVYAINGGQPVPHKVVRTWLKGEGLNAKDELQEGAGR